MFDTIEEAGKMTRPVLHLREQEPWPAASIRDALAFDSVDDALAAVEYLTSPPHREEKTE
jgi:hypothetical protein